MSQRHSFRASFFLGLLGVTIGIRSAGGQAISFKRHVGAFLDAERASAVAVDDGGIYVAGSGVKPGSIEAFVGRYDNAGNELWFRQFSVWNPSDGILGGKWSSG